MTLTCSATVCVVNHCFANSNPWRNVKIQKDESSNQLHNIFDEGLAHKHTHALTLHCYNFPSLGVHLTTVVYRACPCLRSLTSPLTILCQLLLILPLIFFIFLQLFFIFYLSFVCIYFLWGRLHEFYCLIYCFIFVTWAAKLLLVAVPLRTAVSAIVRKCVCVCVCYWTYFVITLLISSFFSSK